MGLRYGISDDDAKALSEFVSDFGVRIVGGCCGTTPQHIAAIAGAARDCTPRAVPASPNRTVLAGLEPMTIAA